MLNSRTSNIRILALLSLLCLVETLSLTYFKLAPAFAQSNALVYFFSGLGIVALALIFSFRPTTHNNATANKGLLPKALLATVALVYLSILCVDYSIRIYPKIPIDYKIADMLPLIKRACQHFVEGKDVYQNPINAPGFWANSYIPYLPAMWLPFVPAYALGVDIRWTLLVVSILSYVCLFYFVTKLPLLKAVLTTVLLFILLFVYTRFFTWEDKSLLFSATQEAVPAFFYLLLFIALMVRKGWLVAVALALCTLSRYSVVLFVPVYFLFLLIDKDYKGSILFVSIYLGVIAVLFIFPFFIQRPQYFLEITQKYQGFEASFWYGRIDGAKPDGSLGIAYAIGYNVPLLKLMKPTMLALLAAFSAAWLGAYYFYRDRILANKEIWLMAGFKLVLLLFYNLISMPFQYLFIVPTIISYPLLLAIIAKTDFTKNKTV